jgi:glycosyltransferase involved in cell wall biosynthesis
MKFGKNILFIAPFPPPITGNSLAVEVLYTFVSNENEVIKINLSKSSINNGFISISRFFILISIFFRIYINKKKADLLYFTISQSLLGNIKDIVIYIICYNKLKSMYIHLHGGAGFSRILCNRKSIQYKINVFFLKKLKGVIVLGETQKKIFVDILPSHKLHIVENFAENNFFVTKDIIDFKYDNVNKIKVLYLSNLIATKGYWELLQGYLSLDTDIQSKVELNFAGGFENNSNKKLFLKSISGISNINYHGIVRGDIKKKLLAESHIFCLPTYYPYEGQPISILEAYASGCVVITTNHSGIVDIFKNNVNGFEVDKKSLNSIREVLLYSFNNFKNFKPISIVNLQHAKSYFTVDKHLNKILKVFKND